MPRDWSGDHESRDGQTNRSDREARILETASRQRHLIRGNQLTAIGLGSNGISHRVAMRRLFVVHRGVYALHPPPYGRLQRWLAAVYAGGPGSLLSRWSGAALLGLREEVPGVAEVTNATGRGRGYWGIRVHRAAVDPRDATTRCGIPCTSAARILLDVAPTASLLSLERLMLAADSLRLLNRGRLRELIDERPGQRGTRRISTLITDDPIETRSENERRMVSICREFGVSPPLVNHRIQTNGRTFYADFCWPHLRLIVEADSWRWHGGRAASESDSDRDQLLAIAGWNVVHFTREQIKRGRAQTGRRLQALTRSGA